MTEENITMNVETNEETNTLSENLNQNQNQTSESNTSVNVSVSDQYLKNVLALLDLAGTRNCFKTSEMLAVGVVYQETSNLLSQLTNNKA